MHYLRNQVGHCMEFAFDMFGWEYGKFNCNAGNHLNEMIKIMELGETNMDQHHIQKIIRNLRIKQFINPETLVPNETTITCSKCNQVGHNKKK